MRSSPFCASAVTSSSVRSSATAPVVYDELTSAGELPIGWGEEQEAGTYRLVRRDDDSRFGCAVGPHSWKQFLQPPHVRLWRARRSSTKADASRSEN